MVAIQSDFCDNASRIGLQHELRMEIKVEANLASRKCLQPRFQHLHPQTLKIIMKGAFQALILVMIVGVFLANCGASGQSYVPFEPKV